MNKQCTKCLETKPLDEFRRIYDRWFQNQCKTCLNVAKREWKRARYPRPVVPPDHKRCPACRETKPLSDFYPGRVAARIPGGPGYCKACSRARQRQAYAANPAHFSAKDKAWQRRNPEKVLAMVAQRRAREAGAEGTFTAIEWATKKADFGHRCAYCLRQDDRLTRDHIVPLARGGKHCEENIVPACRSCNSRKYTKSLLEFVGS